MPGPSKTMCVSQACRSIRADIRDLFLFKEYIRWLLPFFLDSILTGLIAAPHCFNLKPVFR